MKRLGNYIIRNFKRIPWYGWVFGATMLLIQTFFWGMARLFILNVSNYWDSRFQPYCVLDERIPLVPYFWTQIYVCWFVLVPIGGIVAGTAKKEQWINLILSWYAALFVGALIHALAPTYLDEHNVIGVSGGSVYEWCSARGGWSCNLLKLFHNQRYAYNLFPSFHCLNIIFCYLGVARRKEVHQGNRIFWLVIAILVCISTVFTKQHYIMDIFIAAILALISFMIFKTFNPGQAILKKCPRFLIVEKLNWTHEKAYKIIKRSK